MPLITKNLFVKNLDSSQSSKDKNTGTNSINNNENKQEKEVKLEKKSQYRMDMLTLED